MMNTSYKSLIIYERNTHTDHTNIHTQDHTSIHTQAHPQIYENTKSALLGKFLLIVAHMTFLPWDNNNFHRCGETKDVPTELKHVHKVSSPDQTKTESCNTCAISHRLRMPPDRRTKKGTFWSPTACLRRWFLIKRYSESWIEDLDMSVGVSSFIIVEIWAHLVLEPLNSVFESILPQSLLIGA